MPNRQLRPLAELFLQVAPTTFRSLRTAAEQDAHATLNQWRCMHMLSHCAYSLRSLAQHYGVAAPTMSRMISEMVERGWVARAESADDRRQISITLLPAGQAALTEIHERALDHVTDLLAKLTPAERDALMTGLRGIARVTANAPAESPHGEPAHKA